MLRTSPGRLRREAAARAHREPSGCFQACDRFRPSFRLHEAIRCRKGGASRPILFNLCGYGHFDVQTYIEAQALLDLVIRPHRDRLWDGEAELARALEIDGENRCGELFNR